MLAGSVARQLSVVELAVVEKHVRISVRSDRKGALADASTDQRPGLALAMPEADSTVAQVVR